MFAGGGSDSKDGPITLRLAENQNASSPVSVAMNMFADLVAEKTNGEVKVDVYLDAQLGNETETIDQVQIGTLDFARVNVASVQSTCDDFGVLSLPYIFTSEPQMYRVLDGEVGDALNKVLEDNYNMKNLGYIRAGSRNFYTTKKEIRSVADVKGMKIRVQPNDVSIKMVELLGGAATPMAYGEGYQGLQTGVIDGAENDFTSYQTSGHYEVAKNYTLDGHMFPPAVLLVSLSTWNKLSAEHQAAIQEAADEAIEWERNSMREYENESRRLVEEAGANIIEVDVKEFQNAVSPIYDMYPQYKEYLDKILVTE